MRSSCLTAFSLVVPSLKTRLFRLKRPCRSSSRPSTVPTPSSIGSGGSDLRPGLAEVVRLRILGVLAQDVGGPRLGAERDLEALVEREQVGAATLVDHAAERHVDREDRRERDDQHGRDQRDAALARTATSGGRRRASSRHLDDAPDLAPVLEVERDLDGGGAQPFLLARDCRPAAASARPTRCDGAMKRNVTARTPAQQAHAHRLGGLRAVEHAPVVAPEAVLVEPVGDALQRRPRQARPCSSSRRA